MKRIYDTIIKDHFSANRQMIMFSGPRQVGKTTTAKTASPHLYYNWDNHEHRSKILAGYNEILNSENLSLMPGRGTHIIFDEIHKYPKWKNYLKGFFDTYENDLKTIITGSSRLDIFRRGSDSLMGRYFLYRMHPFTAAELVKQKLPGERLITGPKKLTGKDFRQLVELGGFPEPFLKGEKRFYNRWISFRRQQLFREDLRDMTGISEIDQLEILGRLLEKRAGQLVNYTGLASDVRVTVNTVRRWITTLEQFYYCFRLKPWHENVPKTLLKQPKIYFRDWSIVNDEGQRNENMTASHLLKAVELWSDLGYGDFDLYFLRDKLKREVDFLVSRNGSPWFIVEVKTSGTGRISPSLRHFQALLNPKHAFQLDFSAEYIDRDCFKAGKAVTVPAVTFFSQLV